MRGSSAAENLSLEMSTKPSVWWGLLLGLLWACGSGDTKTGNAGTAGGAGAPDTTQGGSNATGASSATGATSGTSTNDSAGATGVDEPPSACEDFGHFGTPSVTFTLPGGKPTISYPDVQKSFPDVDWQKLERLYVPAGKYKTFELGNLPKRDAASPLVITNIGGQVQVGPNLGGNFIWSMGGGSNWILTGRYDPDSKTGDAGFPGHRCGKYENSQGSYGFLSDDAFDHSGQYTHMGLAIGGGATDFELEYLEVTRSGFAGIRLLNSKAGGVADPTQPMANVRVHDTYVHDVDSEGYYFGWTGEPPSYLFPNLQIYNNRIVRTGSEALQIQDLDEGSRIHHNVFAFGALHWLDNFGKYQDGCLQILVRQGRVEFDHNVSLGGAGTFLSFFSSPEANDGARDVTFHDNYFADTRSLGGYLNGSSEAPSSFSFVNNFFRGLDFGYTPVDPAAKDPGVVFGINAAHHAPIDFTGNTFEGPRLLLSGLPLNGAKGSVTAKDNVNAAVEPAAFVDSGYPDVPTSKLSAWGRKATLAADMHDITYAVGDLVMSDAQLYRAKVENQGLLPAEHPEAWEKLPRPADDLRLSETSPYAEMGIH
ncbi:MAG TPA: right-handed parallel beta-helix repeat-containing protein [Polyangiaceae bacterium]|nr:right-handed parallel beta-helix repeat-containing protein [Polyangiaceae bacterium]